MILISTDEVLLWNRMVVVCLVTVIKEAGKLVDQNYGVGGFNIWMPLVIVVIRCFNATY